MFICFYFEWGRKQNPFFFIFQFFSFYSNSKFVNHFSDFLLIFILRFTTNCGSLSVEKLKSCFGQPFRKESMVAEVKYQWQIRIILQIIMMRWDVKKLIPIQKNWVKLSFQIKTINHHHSKKKSKNKNSLKQSGAHLLQLNELIYLII